MRVPARAGTAYGYPLPRDILASGAAADAAVATALGEFSGDGAVVRYEEPQDQPVPERFSEIVVPGRWRFGAQQGAELSQAAVGWIAEIEAGAVR